MSEFSYENPFPLKKDLTKYKHLSSAYVSTITVDGREILKIDPKALELLAEHGPLTSASKN